MGDFLGLILGGVNSLVEWMNFVSGLHGLILRFLGLEEEGRGPADPPSRSSLAAGESAAALLILGLLAWYAVSWVGYPERPGVGRVLLIGLGGLGVGFLFVREMGRWAKAKGHPRRFGIRLACLGPLGWLILACWKRRAKPRAGGARRSGPKYPDRGPPPAYEL